MPKHTTPLETLMSILGISLTETADYLQIDKTTVSKWRTGSRKLSEKSAYFERLIQFFISRNSTKSENPLFSFFKGKYSDLDLHQDDYLLHCLRKFLSSDTEFSSVLPEQSALTDFFSQTAAVLYGIDGLKKALDMLLSIAENSPVPETIRIMEPERMDWLSFDMPFLQNFICRLDALCKKGFQIQFAYSVQEDNRALRVFLQAFEMLLYKKDVQSFLIDVTPVEGIVPTLFMIGEKCSLTAFGQIDRAEEMCVSVFFDYLNSKKNVQLFEKIIEKFGNEVIFTEGADQNSGIIQKIADSFAGNTNRMGYFGDFLSVVTMEESLLCEILDANQLDNETREQCLFFYRTIRNSLEITSVEKPNIYFMNMVMLENALEYESLIEYELSAIAHRQITKTATQYRQHLKQASEWIGKSRNIRPCHFPGFQDSRRTASTWLKKNCYGLSMNFLLVPDQYELIFFTNHKLTDIVFDICSSGLENIQYYDTLQVAAKLVALSEK